jgi:hypothetical protein
MFSRFFVIIVSFCAPSFCAPFVAHYHSASTIGPREDHAYHTIDQFWLVKVDDQAQGDSQEFHITQELRFVDGQNALDTFKFQEEATFNENVEPEIFIENQALVFNSDDALVDSGDFAKLEFTHQASLVNAFDEPRSLKSMNLDRRADGQVTQFVGFGEKRMHLFLHPGNEGNEEPGGGTATSAGISVE